MKIQFWHPSRSALLSAALVFSFSTASFGSPLSLAAGLDIYNFDYQEDLVLPAKSTESAILPAISLGAHWNVAPRSWFLQSNLEFTSGTTHYDGSSFNPQQNTQPLLDTPPSTMLRAELGLGNSLVSFSEISELKIYSGLAYFGWARGDNGVNRAGMNTLRENYNKLILPLGLLLHYQMSDHFSATLDTSLRYAFFSTMRVPLWDKNFDLGNTLGYKMQIPLAFALSGNTGLTLTPWLEYLNNSESDPTASPVGPINEPASRTYQYGSALAFTLGI